MAVTTFNSNIPALSVQRRLGESTAGLRRSYERLATGLRINRASDDAAGLAIADTLRSDIRLYGQALRNMNDGLSMLNIAESSVDSQTNIIQRLAELAEQSANGTLSFSQRRALNLEYVSLAREYARLAQTTTFNGQQLLMADRPGNVSSFSLQVGLTGALTSRIDVNTTDTGPFSGVVNIDPGQNEVQDGFFNAVDWDRFVNAVEDGEQTFFASYSQVATVTVTDTAGNNRELLIAVGESDTVLAGTTISFFVAERQSDGLRMVTVQPSASGFGIDFAVDIDPATGRPVASDRSKTVSIAFSDARQATFTLDFNAIRFRSATTDGVAPTNIEFSNVMSASSARVALDLTKRKIQELATIRGTFGAAASRLITSINNATVGREGASSAESRIRDIDVAEESAALVRQQIIQQVGAQTLSLANRQPELLLSLLRF